MEGNGRQGTDWFGLLLIVANSCVAMYTVYLMRTQVASHDTRITALEAAWGRKDVPVPQPETEEKSSE
jgi:hypothetical protein